MNLIKFMPFLILSLLSTFVNGGESNYKRAGIIVYKEDNATTYFLVGYNGKNLDYLGGLYDHSLDSDIMSAAARGFNEKTMFMFSAGPKPFNEILNIYDKKNISNEYNATIKQIIQQNEIDPLIYTDKQGMEQALYLIPLEKMLYKEPDSTCDSETRPPSLAQQLNKEVLPKKNGGISEYIWLEKTNLYDSLKNTLPGTPVYANAPIYKNLKRKIILSPFLSGVLRNGVNKKGQKGLQSVIP